MAELSRLMAGLFVLLWIAIVAGFGVYMLLGRYRRVRKAWERRLAGVLAVIGVIYTASFIMAGVLLDHFAGERLKAFSSQEIDSLIVHHEGKKTELRDPAVIGELLSIICAAREVGAHHSQPVEKITLALPEAGYTYSLGRDSEVIDEFWLEWSSYPGSDPAIVSITVVKQFQSRALGDWLRRHGLPSAEKS